MKIIIFGGSFNPFHDGHLFLLNKIKANLKFDEIWLLPTNGNFEKSNITQLNKGHKLKIIKLYIENDPKIKINEYELNKNAQTNTYETIIFFMKKYKKHIFELVFGDDIKENFYKWKNAKKLLNLVKIYFFNRINNNKKISNTINLNFGINNCTSSMVRLGFYKHIYNFKLIDYINQNVLFYEERLKYWINQKYRIKHCISVMNYGVYLAKKHNLEENIIKTACVYHDLFKNITKSKDIKKYENKYFLNDPKIKIIPKPALHGHFAAAYIRDEWKIIDKRIINAIRFHTIPTLNMSKYDKIIFCADKFSNEEDFKKIKEYKKKCEENIDLGFRKAIFYNTKRLLISTIVVDWKYYIKIISKYLTFGEKIKLLFFNFFGKKRFKKSFLYKKNRFN